MARGKSFVRQGVRELQDLVGAGKLRGELRIDQVYAKYQHERLDLKHPRGGGPKYLEGPLMANHRNYLQNLSDHVLGGGLEQAMIRNMEALNGAMGRAAPVDFNNLRRSGNPRVFSNGRKVYDRRAQQRRLTKHELKSLRRGRRR